MKHEQFMLAFGTSQRPNKSLKLTEVAVDDFARVQLGATIGRDMPRAEWLRRAAARRRSLAPVR